MDAALKRVLELVTDSRDHRLSMTKIGHMIAGAVFTAKMLRDMPEAVDLWLAYAATLTGSHLLSKLISSKGSSNAGDPA